MKRTGTTAGTRLDSSLPRVSKPTCPWRCTGTTDGTKLDSSLLEPWVSKPTCLWRCTGTTDGTKLDSSLLQPRVSKPTCLWKCTGTTAGIRLNLKLHVCEKEPSIATVQEQNWTPRCQVSQGLCKPILRKAGSRSDFLQGIYDSTCPGVRD